MSMSLVRFEKIGRGVCSILLNRPSKANAVNQDLLQALRGTINHFEEDNECRVAILGGVGANFCAGYDLNEIVDPTTGMPNIQMIEGLLLPVESTRLSEKKIIIAAIEGHAAGFGFELALKCDFRVADRSARMGFLNRRFGVPIMNGGTVILPKICGQARAIELISTGKAQLAPESLQYGVINHISDIGCAIGKALNLARNMVKFPQDALMLDLDRTRNQNRQELVNLQKQERKDALDYLSNRSPPLDLAVKFLSGEIGRHGNTDLGNSVGSMPEVTL